MHERVLGDRAEGIRWARTRGGRAGANEHAGVRGRGARGRRWAQAAGAGARVERHGRARGARRQLGGRGARGRAGLCTQCTWPIFDPF